jgi:hypothetical protein
MLRHWKTQPAPALTPPVPCRSAPEPAPDPALWLGPGCDCLPAFERPRPRAAAAQKPHSHPDREHTRQQVKHRRPFRLLHSTFFVLTSVFPLRTPRSAFRTYQALAFGLRASDLFRTSDFGFRTSPSPRPPPSVLCLRFPLSAFPISAFQPRLLPSGLRLPPGGSCRAISAFCFLLSAF